MKKKDNHKKNFITIIAVILSALFLLAGCGSGGVGAGSSSSSGSSSGTTNVRINVGSADAGVSSNATAAASIPSIIHSIKCVVSGSGINPDIIHEEVVNSSEPIVIKLTVPNGTARHFEIFAYDINGFLIYYGDTYKDLTGEPVNDLPIIMAVADEAYGSISGVVTDADTSGPVSGASITLYLGGIEKSSTASDVSGNYQFEDLFPGDYRIIVIASGYDNSEIEGVQVNPSANTVQNVALLPLGPGSISGVVTDAQTSDPVSGALITLYLGGSIVDSTISDGAGNYLFEDLDPESYSLVVTASGYDEKPIEGIEVNHSANTVQNVALSPLGPGSISGVVTDAVTGDPVPVALISLYICGGNEMAVTTSDVFGNYVINDLNPGDYCLYVTASGYSDNQIGVQVNPGANTVRNIALSPVIPPSGELRIVLTWGEFPFDLDSHLWLPSETPYHIYYSDMGDAPDFPHASLDLDDVSSFGPETITIETVLSGTYVYAVKNYSGLPLIRLSQAMVQVYDQTGLIRTYNVPTTGDGRWWKVFEIDGFTGNITDIDTIVDDVNPY